MPRYKKPRNCNCPFKDLQGKLFKPAGVPMKNLHIITLYRDEVEALRLCDKENLTQEEAGIKMGISRGTVQRLVTSARGKLAHAIIERHAVIFEEEINLKS